MSETARLLVNADDFGLHEDIDRGILDCVERGRVQSISFSPTGKSVDWKKLIELQEAGVRVGVHITLVGEPWASDGRVVSGWKELFKRVLLQGNEMNKAMEIEIRRQFQLCGDNRLDPKTLAHLDSHQHVHAFPGVWEPCLLFANEYGIPRVRVPWCPSPGIIKKGFAGRALQMLAARRATEVAEFLPCLGLAHAGCHTAEIFCSELETAAGAGHPNIEMVVHPGRDTPGLQSRYADWRFHWGGERDALLSQKFIEAVAANDYAFDAPASSLSDQNSVKSSKTF